MNNMKRYEIKNLAFTTIFSYSFHYHLILLKYNNLYNILDFLMQV